VSDIRSYLAVKPTFYKRALTLLSTVIVTLPF